MLHFARCSKISTLFFVLFFLTLSSKQLYCMENGAGIGDASLPRGTTRVRNDNVHVDSDMIVVQTSGTHNFYAHDDFSGGNKDAGFKGKVSYALQRGTLEGISTGIGQIIAAVIVQTSIIALKAGLSHILKKGSADDNDNDDSDSHDEIGHEIAFLKVFSDMVEKQCAQADTDEACKECQKLRETLLKMLAQSAEHIKERYQ